MSTLPAFKENAFPTMGVELELQLVDLQNFNLAMEAKDLLRRLSEIVHPGEIKPEITQAMIELNSSVHASYESLIAELRMIRNTLAEQAAQTHIGICGGGAHPFQKWKEQRIFPTERFSSVSEQYGYLAKQFTVFGQHIHIACTNGDDALYLCHAMARYLPQFIALSAASPFHQGVDTAFDCSRLAVISAFPLSGTPPWLLTWKDFEVYFNRMVDLGIVKSIKDFYWDIRPKPEYGTVEFRICDTPLTVEKAAILAAYAQLLACWMLETRPQLSREIYLTYLYNRFHAARYGLEAMFVDPIHRNHFALSEDILETCRHLAPYAARMGCEEALHQIQAIAQTHENDAHWLRKQYAEFQSLADTVRSQTELWIQ
ncbi:YbdK family carboxylate-amine ligase [Aquicella lusitana]|uniref:Putative glutamate--cysteine ligase 2 n=1 Tax=Aquicella lusitana TaxID=254246 RepID=A0A370GLA2_9COXI|nr:YbdK family carboxylate-amine ligase [Aquicella lusitana]RDI44542.1 carboxylate-amine ligase [Aquicella lusitana]VVC72516.1 Putative glutamate--cysteine ligase 2 [Aquicella lusitana]